MKRYKFSGFMLRISKKSLRLYRLSLKDSFVTITPKVKTDISVYEHPLELGNVDPLVLKERISHGDRVFVAKHQSKPVGYLFAADTDCWVDEIEDRLIVGSGEIYLYDAYTDIEYRRNRIYSALISNAAQYFKNLSYTSAFIFTTASNKISLKGIERSGFSCYQTIRYYNLFGWKIWYYKNRSKNVESRFSNEI